MVINRENIEAFEKQYRTNLINSLSGIKGVHLIGTQDHNKISNLSLFNSIVHIGANPPLIGYIQRPTTVERHTYENILETNYYTINNVLPSFVDKAHQTSARYSKSASEFKKTGLTEQYLNDFQAPFVKESSIKFAMKLHSSIPIVANNTILVIGEVEEIHLPEEFISKDGNIKHYEASSTGIIGLDSYITPQKLYQFSYAKPGKKLIKKTL